VIRKGIALGVPFEHTLSCMNPKDGQHCGRCSKCRCGQAAKCYVAAFGAFENLPGDTPTNPVFFSPN
jgi:7-cyano-7-deazaguanine synthase in queuosine biosynthesis